MAKIVQNEVEYSNNSVESLTIQYSYGSNSGNINFTKCGKIVTMSIGGLGGAVVSTLTSGTTIATLPEGWCPVVSTYGMALGKSAGAWASSNYYHDVMFFINTDGQFQLIGKTTVLQACMYFSGTITYVTE